MAGTNFNNNKNIGLWNNCSNSFNFLLHTVEKHWHQQRTYKVVQKEERWLCTKNRLTEEFYLSAPRQKHQLNSKIINHLSPSAEMPKNFKEKCAHLDWIHAFNSINVIDCWLIAQHFIDLFENIGLWKVKQRCSLLGPSKYACTINYGPS